MSDLTARLFTLQRVMGIRKKDEIAQKLGCSRTMLYNYERGDPPPPSELMSTLADLEAKAGIEPAFTSFSGNGGGSDSCRLIPVIGWAHAGEAGSYDELPKSWQARIPTECQDQKAFAVALEGDSMEPKFSDGDLLIVQPSEEAHSGCYVVARFANDGVIFRRLEMAGGVIRLMPLNDRWPPTEHQPHDFSWIYPVWGRWTQIWRR